MQGLHPLSWATWVILSVQIQITCFFMAFRDYRATTADLDPIQMGLASSTDKESS